MDWQPRAIALAEQVTHAVSRWREPVAVTPRHLLVPRWWTATGDGWELRDGPADLPAWLDAAYTDQTLVTQVGALHADLATTGQRAAGRPASSSTLPSLAVQMYRHARITDAADVLDVGTGSGYGAALLTYRLGPQHVTSIDIDPYLTKAAAERLDGIGLLPHVATCDATGPLPGDYDRIVSMAAVRPVPPSWLATLRPGGRLVTTITGTTAILAADKREDGRAFGRIERDWAGFMAVRHGPGYPPQPGDGREELLNGDGEHVAPGRYPLVIPEDAWELRTMLSIELPGITSHHRTAPDGTATVWLVHADGSWARAEGKPGKPAPLVHQSGPRRLWDLLDELRDRWLAEAALPVYGALAMIEADGTIKLARGAWRATIQ
ncbi:MAG TPA: methyltransferase domain-containing protein [Streptosporangiaceae bacterium]|nr:methyltransferase domain-containing protein [Streptosporangiaceae bacterium]